jgi:hypothetical protein
MSNALPVYPFDPERWIGTVCEVGPSYAKANLPDAAASHARWQHGTRLGAGEVGEFVVLECDDLAVFGRLTNVKLPEKDRLSVQPELGRNVEAHPLGTIQLLTTISLATGQVSGGITHFPRLGSKVYSAHPRLVAKLAERSSHTGVDAASPAVTLRLGTLPDAGEVSVDVTPERLFGRHCAVLGATGGGKSWTLARLLEQAATFPSKVILLDATGEFHTLKGAVKHVHIGHDPSNPKNSSEVVVPYSHLTEADLVTLFNPSGRTQAPKLRAAIRSLKLARVEAALASAGIIKKAEQQKRPFEDAFKKHAKAVEGPAADFEIGRLALQIDEECVFDNGFTNRVADPSKWGGYSDAEKSYCVTLVTRITALLNSRALGCIFQPGTKASLFKTISDFLADKDSRILRVSLQYLPFDYNAREIVANAIGRFLLDEARDGKFRGHPLLVFLDEAHQFLNRWLGEEDTRQKLDAFELVAKEGRKYWLNICMATQRPRDIPEGVLSQMGTLIVHRLVNDKDREVVERASGDIDRSAAAFLPTLAPGEAAVIGVDFPIPLTVQVIKPINEPESRGPDYQTAWKPAVAKV